MSPISRNFSHFFCRFWGFFSCGLKLGRLNNLSIAICGDCICRIRFLVTSLLFLVIRVDIPSAEAYFRAEHIGDCFINALIAAIISGVLTDLGRSVGFLFIISKLFCDQEFPLDLTRSVCEMRPASQSQIQRFLNKLPR